MILTTKLIIPAVFCRRSISILLFLIFLVVCLRNDNASNDSDKISSIVVNAFSSIVVSPSTTTTKASMTTSGNSNKVTSRWMTNQPESENVSNSASSIEQQERQQQPRQHTICRARDLIKSLIEEDLCYTTETGAMAFANVCAVNCVYEDRYEPQPVVGKVAIRQHLLQKAQQRKAVEGCEYRIDKISDGNKACGFAWTWTFPKNQEEGLRGTTFVELNDSGEIQYVQEIPEPIFKPGDLTKDLLKAVTADAVSTAKIPFSNVEQKNPIIANELAKYLFVDLQDTNRTESLEHTMQFFDANVVYRDFNYKTPFVGTKQVKQFIMDFDFPGITFRPLRFDDGIDSTCFTWEVVLADAPDTIKGISFYELDPVTRKITYVRDIPESAIKPPLLGKLARQFNSKLGVFTGIPINSRGL